MFDNFIVYLFRHVRLSTNTGFLLSPVSVSQWVSGWRNDWTDSPFQVKVLALRKRIVADQSLQEGTRHMIVMDVFGMFSSPSSSHSTLLEQFRPVLTINLERSGFMVGIETDRSFNVIVDTVPWAESTYKVAKVNNYNEWLIWINLAWWLNLKKFSWKHSSS